MGKYKNRAVCKTLSSLHDKSVHTLLVEVGFLKSFRRAYFKKAKKVMNKKVN